MAAPPDHHDLHIVVLFGAIEGGGERDDLLPVEAVLDVGSVQPDGGDAIADLVLNGAFPRRDGLLLNTHRSLLLREVAKLNSDHIWSRSICQRSMFSLLRRAFGASVRNSLHTRLELWHTELDSVRLLPTMALTRNDMERTVQIQAPLPHIGSVNIWLLCGEPLTLDRHRSPQRRGAHRARGRPAQRRPARRGHRTRDSHPPPSRSHGPDRHDRGSLRRPCGGP